jgi:hypothetical protein
MLVSFPRALPATPLENLVEGAKVRARSSVGEEAGGLKSGHLLGHRYGHKLVDARPPLSPAVSPRP